MKLVSLPTIRNYAWIEGWQPDNCGCGSEGEIWSLLPLVENRYMAWSVCQASTRHLTDGSMVSRRRAFVLFQNNCLTLGVAASSTLIWVTPHRIPFTGELGIGL
jgi:hypothetical protein